MEALFAELNHHRSAPLASVRIEVRMRAVPPCRSGTEHQAIGAVPASTANTARHHFGHVVSAKAHSKESPDSQIEIAFDRAITKDGRELPQPVDVQGHIDGGPRTETTENPTPNPRPSATVLGVNSHGVVGLKGLDLKTSGQNSVVSCAVFSGFQGNADQFFCIPDYVAQGKEFEPSVQLWNAAKIFELLCDGALPARFRC